MKYALLERCLDLKSSQHNAKDVLEYIRRSNKQAELDAAEMKASLEAGDKDAFYTDLFNYLITRFGLASIDIGGETNIEELARKSLIVQNGEKSVLESDKAINCSNASTAEDKVILFMLVVQKSLGLKLDPSVVARIETMPQLCGELWKAHQRSI